MISGLLELGAEVRGLVRAGSEDKLPKGVEAAAGDLNDPESLRGPLEGVSGVFLLSGYDSIEKSLDLMGEAGVERVVLLSSSAAPTGDLGNAVMSNAFRWLPQLTQGDVIRGPSLTSPSR